MTQRAELILSMLSVAVAVIGVILLSGVLVLRHEQTLNAGAGAVLGMAIVGAVSGTVGIWLHAIHGQPAGLIVNALAILLLVFLSFSLLLSFSIVLLPTVLLAVVAEVIGLGREIAGRRTLLN